MNSLAVDLKNIAFNAYKNEHWPADVTENACASETHNRLVAEFQALPVETSTPASTHPITDEVSKMLDTIENLLVHVPCDKYMQNGENACYDAETEPCRYCAFYLDWNAAVERLKAS